MDKNLYKEVRGVLNKNLSERHIRGGIATKNKYLGKPL
ncbi:MAG: sporulation transcriptional regulator SpoIIID [Clostridia bacterium]|nr:sporulation transcriptional regulator SpoIIID [Clostridia bacterium]